MAGRPVLCRLCEEPVVDTGIPMAELDAEKLGRWWRLALDTEFDDDDDTIQSSLICQFCLWDAKYLEDDKAFVELQKEKACDWWTGHDTNKFYRQFYYDKHVIKRCSLSISPLDPELVRKTSVDCKIIGIKQITASEFEAMPTHDGFCGIKLKRKTPPQSPLPQPDEQHACEICPDSYPSLEQKRLHMTTSHTRVVCCHWCLVQIPEFNLWDHVVSSHKNAVVADNLRCCEIKFENVDEFLLHVKSLSLNTLCRPHALARRCDLNVQTSLQKSKIIKKHKTDCPYCGVKCESKTAAFKHAEEFHKESEIFTCKKCIFLAKTAADLDAHKFKKHFTGPVQCHCCNHRIPKPLLLAHLDKVHSDIFSAGGLRCCNTDFNSKDDLIDHINSLSLKSKETPPLEAVSPEPPANVTAPVVRSPRVARVLTCTCCRKTFKTKAQQTLHIRTSHSSKIKCHCCNRLVSEGLLVSHVENTHKNLFAAGQLKCCEKEFLGKTTLMHHIRSLSKKPSKRAARIGDPLSRPLVGPFKSALERQRKCVYCGLPFQSYFALYKHALEMHTNVVISCKGCHRVFKTEAERKAHDLNVHHKNVVCHVCKSRVPLQNFFIHLHKHHHNQLATFSCCDTKFKNKRSLVLHIKSLSQKIITQVSDTDPTKVIECVPILNSPPTPLNQSTPSQSDAKITVVISAVAFDSMECGSQESVGLNSLANHAQSNPSNQSCTLPNPAKTAKNAKCGARKPVRTKCLYCEKIFDTRAAAFKHALQYHKGINKICCKCCKKLFETEDELKAHRVSTHESQVQCHLCEMGFRKSRMLAHFRKEHLDILSSHNLSCCQKGFNSTQELVAHAQTHSQNSLQPCAEESLPGAPSSTVAPAVEILSSTEAQVDARHGHVEKISPLVPELPCKPPPPVNARRKTNLQSQIDCPHCEKIFKTRKAVFAHAHEAHTDMKVFSCRSCCVLFKSSEQFKQHANKVHNQGPVHCHLCLKKISVKNMLLHLESAHASLLSDKERRCCGILFQFKEELLDHFVLKAVAPNSKDRKAVGLTECPFCHKNFVNKRAAYTHAQDFHKGAETLSCNSCKFIFKNAAERQKHKNISHRRLFHCHYCGKLERINLMMSHLQKNHLEQISSNVFKCCGSEFSRKEDLCLHLKGHEPIAIELNSQLPSATVPANSASQDRVQADAAPAQSLSIDPIAQNTPKNISLKTNCPSCEQLFNRKRGAYNHAIKAHKNIDEYLCKKCGVVFNDPEEGNMHKNRVHFVEVLCHLCQAKIKRNGIANHLSTAHGNLLAAKEHKCCDFVFETVGELNYHIHSNCAKVPLNFDTGLQKNPIPAGNKLKSKARPKTSLSQSKSKVVQKFAHPKNMTATSILKVAQKMLQKHATQQPSLLNQPPSGEKPKLLVQFEKPSPPTHEESQSVPPASSFPTSALTKCVFCKVAFESNRAAYLHAVEKHSEVENFVCRPCCTIFKSADESKLHKIGSHYKEIQCHCCQQRVPGSDWLGHLNDKNKGQFQSENPSCCNTIFDSSEELMSHMLFLSPEAAAVIPAATSSKAVVDSKPPGFYPPKDFIEVGRRVVFFPRKPVRQKHSTPRSELFPLFKASTKISSVTPKAKLVPVAGTSKSANTAKETKRPKITFKCVYCDAEFLTKKECYSHVPEAHKDRKIFWCGGCRLHFKSESEKVAHIKKFHATRGFSSNEISCHFCRGKVNKMELTEHIENDHRCLFEQATLKCCAEIFEGKEELLLHIQSHSLNLFNIPLEHADPSTLFVTEVGHNCLFCEERFESASDAYYHGLKHHKDIQKFSCEICEIHFPTAMERWGHEQNSHNEEVQCHCCQTKLKHFDLEEHIYGSHEELLLTQTCCMVQFDGRYELVSHIKSLSQRSSVHIAKLT